MRIAQILAIPDTLVVAGVRTPEKATDLQKLVDKHGERLHIVKLDLANTDTILVRLSSFLWLPSKALTARACGRLCMHNVQTGIKSATPYRLP